MKSCFIETYGCQMNKAESAALEIVLAERGWQLSVDAEAADLIVLNTCSVRETAETRALGRIDHYLALRRKRREQDLSPLTILVCGCMAERIGPALLERGVDYAIGTRARSVFPEILEAVETDSRWVPGDEEPVYHFSSSHHSDSSVSALVPVMHGCNNFCTYCIVPYVRGREVSRDPESVVREIHTLLDAGIKEITLLGQNVNSYSYGEGSSHMDFPDLLDLVACEMGAGTWLRFLSSHPKDYDERLTGVIAAHENIPRYLHLCVQHGSNTILDAMNRRYTRESYLEKVGNIRSVLPEMHFSTDILMGFPGETEEDVEETLSLMEQVRFSNAFMYHYNPREGTKAFDLPDRIPYEVKTARLQRVIDLQMRHTKEHMAESVGKRVKVLIEGPSRKKEGQMRGRTERDESVVFTGDIRETGAFKCLEITELRGKTLRAKEPE